MKKLAIGLVLSLACCSFAANAADVCSKLPGSWFGHGKVIFDSVPFEMRCVYSGVASITSSDPNAHTFSSDITLSLLSGICPQTVNITLPGTCNNGHISIVATDPYGSANLTGQINQNGKIAAFSGNVDFTLHGKSILGHLDRTIFIRSN